MGEMPWTEKYRPESLKDIQGNNTHIRELKNWARTFSPGDKPQLFVGDPGIGKTATAHALARDMDWEVLDFNASSERDADAIERIAQAIQTGTVDGGHQLVLLDEADSYHHASNLKPIGEAMASPMQPVIVVANEEWKVPNELKRRCNDRKFSLRKDSIKAKLTEIAMQEDLDVSPQDLGKLATRGNLRAAIADLQRFGSEEVDWDDRSDEKESFDAMDDIMRGKRVWNTELNPEELVIWIEQNIRGEYMGFEAAMAFQALSRADHNLWRARSTSNYRYWKFASELANMVPDLRVTESYGGYLKKSYPEWFRHSVPKPTGNDGVARLYRALKDVEGGSFQFGGNYLYFRKVVLPILLDMPDGVRLRVALNTGLGEDTKALKELGLSKKQFGDWVADEGDESYDQHVTGDISEW